MRDYFDSLETRSGDEREAELFADLPANLQNTMEGAPGWATFLSGIDPSQITDRAALAQLPVLRKSTLKQMQSENPPLAGFALGSNESFGRVFMSPGPIFEPMGTDADPWHGARAMFAAGFRKGDLIHNCFSYHLTPGGFILDNAARAMGCAVIPAGIGNTELQLDAIEQLRPCGYTGTPDYLKILLDKAQQLGRDASSISRALVSGGALFPSLRQEYANRGIAVLQCYATADVGVIAYESQAQEGMIVNEGKIVEIVRPGTAEPVPEGDVGEVVVTSFNAGYPMIRLATGDLSAILPGISPCGRTGQRIKGWMGRADQTAKVKGMFIHPSQIADIGKQHPELKRLRLVVERDGANDKMTLKAETREPTQDLHEAVRQTLQTLCKVRGIVELCAVDSLPNDGLVIADERDYSA
jgi:phenylacetate-CoA ligase